jgi:hypothetical protein
MSANSTTALLLETKEMPAVFNNYLELVFITRDELILSNCAKTGDGCWICLKQSNGPES